MDDKAAFDRMFNEWYAQFVYFAYYFVNDVEVCRDIVSDAFEYLWRNYDKIYKNNCLERQQTAWSKAVPFSHWRFFVSFDLFSFPWKKYRINKPSRGTDGLIQATFNLVFLSPFLPEKRSDANDRHNLSLNYRNEAEMLVINRTISGWVSPVFTMFSTDLMKLSR